MAPLRKVGIDPICGEMRPAPDPAPDLSIPHLRGRLGLWSDRVKALLLLVVLALSGGAAGLLSPGIDNDRGRTSVGGQSARTQGPAQALAVLASEQQTARADATVGGPAPAPCALALAELLLPLRVGPSPLAAIGTYRPAAVRPGHDARVPTGPPARLSA